MYRIVSKTKLNDTVTQLEIEAPDVARRAEPGQFVILRVDADGERIPLTIAGYDRARGLIQIIFQIVGATTMLLDRKEVGDCICDFVGPLGRATECAGLQNVLVVGGGVGCAIALPIAEKLHRAGCRVTSVIGFRTEELVILEDRFRAASDECCVVTDDGSYGEKGNVCIPLKQFLDGTETYDHIFAIGPLVMMKFAVAAARPYGVPCTVSMNPIMIDGTGMCGGCRLSVGGKIQFACVDGPDFDGYAVDFDEAMSRASMYRPFETQRREESCNLMNRKEGGNQRG